MTDLKQEILARVDSDLQKIEQALSDNLNPYLELVSQVAGHILFSGGKRMRPLLMVLSARLCNYRGDYDITFSTAFEYLHAATLLHDDLVDGAELRRGSPVANNIWGNAIAVLVGDYLLSRALTITAGTRHLEVIEIVGAITEKMSQGEIFQLMRKGDLSLREDEYMEIIRGKTAVLFEGACRVSAIISGAGKEKEAAMARYGHHLGMAFQIADDLFDYTFETGQFGKKIGADMREGKMTLPLIYALQQAPAAEREKMKKIVADPNFTDAEFQELISLLDRFGGLEYTRKLAADHLETAKTALDIFDDGETKTTMLMLTDYVLKRSV